MRWYVYPNFLYVNVYDILFEIIIKVSLVIWTTKKYVNFDALFPEGFIDFQSLIQYPLDKIKMKVHTIAST